MKAGTPGRGGLEDRRGTGVGGMEENGEQAELHQAVPAALRKKPQHSHATEREQAWPTCTVRVRQPHATRTRSRASIVWRAPSAHRDQVASRALALDRVPLSFEERLHGGMEFGLAHGRDSAKVARSVFPEPGSRRQCGHAQMARGHATASRRRATRACSRIVNSIRSKALTGVGSGLVMADGRVPERYFPVALVHGNAEPTGGRVVARIAR